MTAEHCVTGFSVTLRVGEHDRFQNDGEKTIQVRRAIPHPDGFDIALLELSEDLVFSPTVRPVCLPTDTNVDYEGMPGMSCPLF